MPQLYHPTPATPSSSTTMTTTPHRPPSRSEQLLREALMKHEQERNPLPPARAHQRRHTHVPSTSSRAEDLSRANFISKSPSSHCTPPSPSSLSRRHSHTTQAPGQASAYLTTASSPRRARSPSVASSSLRRSNVPQPLALSPHQSYSPPESLPMTPHEQVLKARLEQVLATARASGTAEWTVPTPAHTSSGNSVDDERDDDDDDNYVVDENGGRAWGASRRRSSCRGSISARSGSREEMMMPPSRQRSRTDPTVVSPHRYPSPKRSSTTPSFHLYGRRSGTTPPLVSDGSPTPEEEEEEEEEEDQEEDLRLLTPPPTPPTHGYHHYTVSAYTPSPYKPSFDHRRGGSHRLYSEDDEVDADVEEGSELGYSKRRQYGTLSPSHRPHHPRVHPNQQHPDAYQHRPQQFNVRRASERCKEMDGFVSFAAIEGLGAPVDGLDSEDSEEEERRKKMEEERVKRGGVGEWVRWTKKRLLGQQEQQCVL